MPSRPIEIYCINTGSYIPVEGGDTLADLYARIADKIPFRPICARVNNKTEHLGFPVYAPKQVEFLSIHSGSGHRAYIRSLCMMLYKAVTECYPGAKLSMEHSISRGYYCRVYGADAPVDDTMLARLTRAMRELVQRDLPFERHERMTAHVRELFASEGLSDKVKLLDSVHSLYTTYYTLDGIADSYYGCLAPSTSHLQVFDLRLYKEGFLLLGFDPQNEAVAQTPSVQEKMYRAFTDHLRFNAIIGVKNVGELNETVRTNRTADLINVAEALHDKQIAAIADEITRRYHEGGARVVLIAGPSSSGKTTTTKRLAVYLMTNLLRPRMISLDDYFVNRDVTPRDEHGDYDYESLYALDLAQFNSDLNTLIAGGEVELPSYNFELGCRQYKGRRIRLDEGSILLIEGIHGLNPELTAAIDEKMKYRVYVSALTTLSIDDHNWVPTTDNRLLRRIIRDHKYRGTSAVETIRRWPSVRRGEEKWIFPFQENADSMFNSSLIFELGVMKAYGEAILKDVPSDCPEYGEAYRLRRFLSYFQEIGERHVPPTSLLREFLGGSSFHY
ncbi:MAG: nucleoside kinase [Muribaculaceae bacterium]|nr:nucleoside kinase [Muribaculaceae bacterium]